MYWGHWRTTTTRGKDQKACGKKVLPLEKGEKLVKATSPRHKPIAYSKDQDLIRIRESFPTTRGFPCGSDGKESACYAGELGSIPGSGRSLVEGHGNPLQYSCLGNPMDRGVWQATVHGVTRVGHDLVTKPPPPENEASRKKQNQGMKQIPKNMI